MSDASWGLIPYPKTRRQTDTGALWCVPTTLHTTGRPTFLASRFRAWSLPAPHRSAVARHRYLDLARRDVGVPHACRRPAPGHGRHPRSVRHVVAAPVADQHRRRRTPRANPCGTEVAPIEASIRRLDDRHRDTLEHRRRAQPSSAGGRPLINRQPQPGGQPSEPRRDAASTGVMVSHPLQPQRSREQIHFRS